jgi:hypothetical protein
MDPASEASRSACCVPTDPILDYITPMSDSSSNYYNNIINGNNLNNHTDIHSDSTNNFNISDISNNHHGTSNNNLHNNTFSTTFFSSPSRSRLNDARFRR